MLSAEEIAQVTVIDAQVHELAELSEGAYADAMAVFSNGPRGLSG